MDEIRKLADAVLYEGYILWPYRRSALKNQKRWTFGGVFPPSHSAEHPDDRSEIQAQCLLEHDGEPDVDARVRFLHVVERRIARDGELVDEATVAGERHLAWDEATERELLDGTIDLPAGRVVEPVGDGVEIVRTWESLRGRIDVDVEATDERLSTVTVRVANETPWRRHDREGALRRTFCSTHIVLRTEAGAFVSPLEAGDRCENVGVWPVLVGEEGDRQTILASPIILDEYPRIAPESPGDLFDAGEIDRLLIVNVLSMSEAEQEEMRATDPRVREILERCAALGPEELLPLHGAIREFKVSEA